MQILKTTHANIAIYPKSKLYKATISIEVILNYSFQFIILYTYAGIVAPQKKGTHFNNIVLGVVIEQVLYF